MIKDKGVLLLPGGTDVRPKQYRNLELLEAQWREQKALNAAPF